MKIGGISGAAPNQGARVMQQEDSVSRSIQKQIANKQKELQNLSSNQEMDMEEKRKKRQELMQEISDLNNQLRQHQIEQRREAANAKKKQESSPADSAGRKKQGAKGGAENPGLSKGAMQAMVSADAAAKQAQVQGSAVSGMENRAAILKTEIKQDKALGADVAAKEEELAKTQQRAEDAKASQIDTLDAANKEIKDAQAREEPEAASRKETEDGKAKQKEEEQENKDAPGIRNQPSIDIYL